MRKDVIYIDIEDDITSIIERLKSSPEKIVAMVPPKGNAVLQSIVNLKLLKRAADSVDKRPVIVTNNHALQALSGGIGIYVAKNLQSKPTVPSTEEIEELPDDDVEVTDTVATAAAAAAVAASTDEGDLELSDDELTELESEDGTGSVPLKDSASNKPKKSKDKADKKSKVPNFTSFRKKLLIGGGIALLLIIVLLFVFGRSTAKVVVRAETTPVDVQFDATIDAALTRSNPDTAQIRAIPQEQKKTLTQSFTATGQKDLGTKASGDMTLSIKCSDVNSFPTTVPAGTGVSANGLTFITQSSTSLSSPAGGGGCSFSGKTTVTAKENGDKYNLSSRIYSVSGNKNISGRGSAMSGGTSRMVTIVTQGDVDKATEALKQQDSSSVKDELAKQFDKGVRVLDDTFEVNLANISSQPAADQEANEGTLTAEAAYSMLGFKNDDLSDAMNVYVVSQMTDPDQQNVYDNGYKNLKLEKKSGSASNAVYTVTTVAQYGPQFDTEELSQQLAGNKVGEARSTVSSLPGVKSVDINLSPFWSNTLPNPSRITITIEVDRSVSG